MTAGVRTDRFEKLGVVLDVDAASGPDARAVDRVALVQRDDQFRLWYTGATAKSAGIFCMESGDPVDWSGERLPVLDEGPTGSGGVCAPYALYHQHLWYLWYTVAEAPELPADRGASVWCSISSDADRWLGHTVTLQPAGDFEAAAVAEPAVVRDPRRNRWLMTYAASDGTQWRIGLAYSNDLMNWTRVGHLLEGWHAAVGACRAPRLIPMGDAWLLVFTAEEDGRWAVYGSTSSDLVWWRTPQPLIPPGLPTERDGQRAGFPLRVGDDLYVYYGGLAEDRWRTHAAVARGWFSPAP